MQKENKAVIHQASSPRHVVGDLPLARRYQTQRVFSYLTNNTQKRDSRQKHSGMTTLFSGRAFTLIELLVVVLIIGILSAIALPQYQKAVVKSRFSEALINLKAIGDAHQVCYLEKGEACEMSELSITPPGEISDGYSYTKHFTFTTTATPGLLVDAMGNPVWSFVEYRQEDVCICYLQTGELVLSQDYENAGCTSNEALYDYAKLLGIREVPYAQCGCC